MVKIAMLFPGQGPQYPGMGKMIFNDFPESRKIYEEASDVLHYDLMDETLNSDFDHLSDTRFAQPALIAAGYTGFKYFHDGIGSGAIPAFMAGHSMGEITALLCAGAINFRDALFLGVRRGELMYHVTLKNRGTMAGVKECDWNAVADLCKAISTREEPVSIAAFNSDKHVVLTGHSNAVLKVGEICSDAGAIFTPLNISVASHCSYMEEIVIPFQEAVHSVKISLPTCPVYSCLSGKIYRSVGEILTGLTDQLIHPVRWKNIIGDMKKRGVSIFLESGPGSTLCKFIEDPHATSFSIEKTPIDDIRIFIENKIGVLSTPLTHCLSIAMSLPNFNDDVSSYKTNFLPLYNNIIAIQNELERKKKVPSIDEIRLAVAMVQQAMILKKIPDDEQGEIHQEMLRYL